MESHTRAIAQRGFMNWDEVAPVSDPVEVAVELLHFDTNNPRFTPDKRPENDSDVAIVSKLARTADLAELIQSIATSGYINIEPLIVVVRDDKLVVLEGNRRLAAIKCLRDETLAEQAKVTVPDLSDRVLRTLDGILVYRVAQEKDAKELIGFKHINGPQSWDAYAKAVYAARWLDAQDEESTPLSLLDIADRMGDKHATIHRMVTAYYVLQQAEKEGLYQIEDRKKRSFSFSHLYTALSYSEFTDYLGMDRPVRSQDPSRAPVPQQFFGNLRQLLVWLYGSSEEDIAPVIRSQNPDLGRLRHVLSSASATRELAAEGNLGVAELTATPKYVRFSNHLIAANSELHSALETLDGFSPEGQAELEEIAISAEKRSKIIRQTVVEELRQMNAEEGGGGG